MLYTGITFGEHFVISRLFPLELTFHVIIEVVLFCSITVLLSNLKSKKAKWVSMFISILIVSFLFFMVHFNQAIEIISFMSLDWESYTFFRAFIEIPLYVISVIFLFANVWTLFRKDLSGDSKDNVVRTE